MSLKNKILKDITVATKNQDKPRLKALRFLQSAIKNKEIELRPSAITDEKVIQVISKQVKQIQESLEHYKKAEGYGEQAGEEEYNLSVLREYLPQPLSPEDIEKIVTESVEEAQPQSLKDMGRVMKVAREKTKGAVDGKTLSEKIRSRLQNL